MGKSKPLCASAAHTPQQRHLRCTLGGLVQAIADEGLASPAVLVIGEVATLGAMLPVVAEMPGADAEALAANG